MTSLAEQKCVPCEGGVSPLTDAQTQEYKSQVPDWKIITQEGSSRLQRTYSFTDFQTALDFTNKVGAAAESEGHHPLLCTTWGETTVTWWTHAINGLHENDFVMAARTDQIARDFSK